jgi:predicted DNA-binding transcriptional regulator YafY
MNRQDRLIGIIMVLQARPATAQSLADRFEVSRRTILRDIDTLSQLRVPIVALPGRNGGYSLPADYSMPPIHPSEDEATILLMALARFTPGPTPRMAASAQSITDKLLAIMPEHIRTIAAGNLRNLTMLDDIERVDEELLRILQAAARDGAWLRFEHERRGMWTERVALPVEIQLADGRWYVRAIDAARRAERTFRLSRIRGAFIDAMPADAQRIVAEASAAAGSYHHHTHPEVHCELTAAGVAMAKDHPDFGGHLDGSTLRFRCPPAELPFYAREVLRFGVEVTIVGDDAFQAELSEFLVSITSHHRIQ